MLSREQARALVAAGLCAGGIDQRTAETLARRAVVAECDGYWRQGLMQVLAHLRRVEAGQVDGQVTPALEPLGRHTLIADARGGFVAPAIEQGLTRAIEVAGAEGYCSLQVYGVAVQDPGALGYYMEPAAEQGLIALGFDVAGDPQAAAGPPLSLVLPRQQASPLVVDVSAAELAQGHLWLAGAEQQSLPEGWALDDQGRATTDADHAAAVGDSMGARMALIAGLMAAAIGESVDIGLQDLSDTRDGPRFIVIDPVRLGAAAADFGEQLDAILALAVMDRDAPLPGSQRQQARERVEEVGLRIDRALYDALTALAERGD